MWSQRITWTALPWGFDEQGRPRISAFASLRLGEDQRTTLARFPDIADWTALVDGATFEVVAEPGGNSTTTVLSAGAEPTLWRALFPETSPVEPFEFRDHSAREVVSYGVRDVLTAIRETYGQIAATSGQQLPPSTYTGKDTPTGPLDRLVQQIGSLLGVADVPKELPSPGDDQHWPPRKPRKGPRQRLREQFGPGRLYGSGPADVLDPESSGLSGRPLEFARAWHFHHRPETRTEPYRREPDPAHVHERPKKRKLDFHDALALLADHPVLLRRLGLVVDLALDRDVVSSDGRLRLVVTHGGTPDARTEIHQPWTRYSRTTDVFAPGDAGDVRRGMLALAGATTPGESPGDFDVVQIDPDSAALQVVNAASTMKALAVGRALDYASFDTPKTGSLPTLRSAGLAIVRSARGQALAARLQATKALDTAAEQDVADPTADPQTELDADHLVRGWRIDVQRERRGAAEPGPWLSLHRRRSTYLLRGAPIGTDEADDPHEHRGEGYLKSTSATSSPASTAMYLHESLARWAGWSLAVERPARVLYAAEKGTKQDEVVEQRRAAEVDATFGFEARHELVAGTLPALRFGDRYRLRARAVDLAGNALRQDEASDDDASAWQELLRWEPVAPPDLVARERFPEGASLGRLVIRSDAGVDTASYTATGRDERVDERHVVAPQSSVFMAEAHGALDTAQGRPDPVAYAVAKREAGTLSGTTPPWRKIPGKADPTVPPAMDRLPDGTEVLRDPPGTYYVFDADELPLPYLPEVPASGWAVRDAATGAELEARPWNGAWPDAPPVRLALREAAPGSGPTVDWDGRVLTIGLEQAATLRVWLSSTLDDRLAECFGVLRWAADHGADVVREAVEGRHWMVTPPREAVLVHAVQRPLWIPEVVFDSPPPPDSPDGLHARRDQGDTFADLHAELRLHVRSTGQLGIDAAWSEWSDDAQNPRPEQLHSTGRVANVPVPASLEDGVVGLPFRSPDLKKKDRAPEPVRHEFGDTRHRLVDYTLRAATRFREYFPPSMHERPEMLEQDPVTCAVHVRSSARPMAPRPRYAVPVVRWERSGAEAEGWEHLRSERHGGGVRVWLERPWYSSGDEELLGVVLDPDREVVPPILRGLVSQVGRDPIWDTGRPGKPLRPQDFSGDETHWRNSGSLSLAEVPSLGGALAAVGYEPTYDEQRRLWLADVWLPGPARSSYTPFVRLALARYQPWSLSDCHLSRVALLDFLQLLPTRTLTVRWIDDDTFDVVLCGVAPDGPHESRVEVGIEHHDGQVPGDLGWKPYAGHDAIRLDEGLIEEPEWEFELPGGFLHRAPFVEGKATREVRMDRITPESVPMVHRDLVAHVLPGVELELERLPHEIPMWMFPGHRCWSARVTLPTRRGVEPQRLVVRELERIRSDHEALPNANIEYEPVGERVVYLETVRLAGVGVEGI